MTDQTRSRIRGGFNLLTFLPHLSAAARELFDEFVREEEFGLALQLLCDSLVADSAIGLDDGDLAQISELFAVMGLDDEGMLKVLRERV